MLSDNNKNIPEFFPHFLIVHMVSVYSQLISLNFSPENLSIEWSFLGEGSECFQFLTSNPLSHASSSFFVPPPAGYSLFMSKKQSYI